VGVRRLQDDVAGRDPQLRLDVVGDVGEAERALLVGDRVALIVQRRDHRLVAGAVADGNRARVDVAQDAGGLMHGSDSVAAQVEAGQARGSDIRLGGSDRVDRGGRR
jgi:hypothetical protein